MGSRSDAQAIEQSFAEFMSAFNSADLDRLRACYTDDAVLMAPGQSSLTGPTAIIEHMWAPLFENFEAHGELPPTEIQCWGDWGFVRGNYELTLQPTGGGDRVADKGQFLDVVRKDPTGVWKIARAIWNSTGD